MLYSDEETESAPEFKTVTNKKIKTNSSSSNCAGSIW